MSYTKRGRESFPDTGSSNHICRLKQQSGAGGGGCLNLRTACSRRHEPGTGGQRQTTTHSRLKDCGHNPKSHEKPLGFEPAGLRIQVTL